MTRLRMLPPLLLCGALMLLVAAHSPAAPAATAGCGPSRAGTLASSAAARVYALGHTDYACANATGHVRRLGSNFACVGTTRVGPFALAGSYLVYGVESCGVDTGSSGVVELNLPRLEKDASATAFPKELGAESYTQVRSVVVRGGTGSVAWIVSGSSIVRRGRPFYGVYVMARQPVSVRGGNGMSIGVSAIDEGTRIVPDSLRLKGTRLSWRDGSRTRHAVLR